MNDAEDAAPAVRQAAELRAVVPMAMRFGCLIAALGIPPAHAQHLEGETLDAVADVASWVVLVVAPVIVIVLFWLVHILPEKIAEKRKHPQAKAIQALCLLSLLFGGMLWPLAWLWAYSKPVLHKIAYGTDVTEHEPGEGPPEAEAPEPEATAEPQRLHMTKAVERKGHIPDEPRPTRERA